MIFYLWLKLDTKNWLNSRLSTHHVAHVLFFLSNRLCDENYVFFYWAPGQIIWNDNESNCWGRTGKNVFNKICYSVFSKYSLFYRAIKLVGSWMVEKFKTFFRRRNDKCCLFYILSFKKNKFFVRLNYSTCLNHVFISRQNDWSNFF